MGEFHIQESSVSELISTKFDDDRSGHFWTVHDPSGEIVGRIDVPTDFCPMDQGGCEAGPPSFTHDGGWFLHIGCGRPTKSWWTQRAREIITFKE